ncbi:MAG: PH domain-containing protein, partial [Sulfitobacter sp.]|nr:PH domain-containing protein [Sulfitobacter sp.]
MSQVLYEANPSLVRMNPLGAVIAILLLCGGIVSALPPVAGQLAAMVGQPELTGTIVSIAGMAIAALAFFRLLVWWVATKLDQLIIKEDEIVWTHGWLNKQYTEISMSS